MVFGARFELATMRFSTAFGEVFPGWATE